MATSERTAPPCSDVTDRPPTGSSLGRVLSQRDFRLLVGGSSTSLLGDQFALLATPWLALQLTGDPVALGIVLALEGVPRAVLMLVGGAVTDRVSPRRVMLAADLARGLLTGLMAALALVGVAELWMLYGFALGFGVVAGFAVPAENSMVPTLVARSDLQAGNAVIMGITQIAGFVGPTLAGLVIASRASSTTGVGLAFGVDAATFAVSAATFALMRPRPRPVGSVGSLGLAASIREGVSHLWSDEAMRFVFCVLAAVNLFVVGPLMVGIPLLAQDRLGGGAGTFGVLMAAFSLGNLTGYLVAGATRPPSARAMTAIVLGVLTGYGLVVGSLAMSGRVGVDALALAALGAGNGYLALSLFTWLQARTPEGLLGRIVSLVTFASIGVVAISQLASGVLGRWDLDALFLASGGLVLATTVWAASHPGLRALTAGLVDPSSTNHKELSS